MLKTTNFSLEATFMKKNNKKDTLNLIFSAFLIVGFIVCSYFFLTMSASKPEIQPYINTLVFVVFGLIIFYATRVGEGKPVKRFSLWTLLILDIPALYAILAHFMNELPLHDQITYMENSTALSYSPLFIMACIVLGYGIPYTFLSGFEMTSEDEDPHTEDELFCEETGMYILADEETDGALLVVDDLDTAFDESKEIRISDVVPCAEDVKTGSFVVWAEDVQLEEAIVIEADTDEPSEDSEDSSEEAVEETAAE